MNCCFKKVIFGILSAVFIAGCSDQKGWFQDNGKMKVVSTTAQVNYLVAAVGGERVDTWVLIRGDMDPHRYEIVKGDGTRLQKADLVFYSGLGLEHGAALSSWLQTAPNAIGIADQIAKKRPDRVLSKDGVADPHIWMDISLWKEGVPSVVEAMSLMDPEGASEYAARGEALMQEMETVHAEVWSLLHQVPQEKRYLVTSHDAFHYFTRSYLAEQGEAKWAERFAAPEGLAPEGQLTFQDIRGIIDYLNAKNVKVLFPESNVSRDSIRKIANAGKELGLEIQVCSEPLYGDSMSGLSYPEMMRKNGLTIQRYLLCMQ